MVSQSVVAALLLGSAYSLQAAAMPVDSIYTELSPDHCKTIKIAKQTGGSVQECPGVAGFRLLVEDDDARQSVTIVSPDGKRHPLDFGHVITSGFSAVGDKAEWRVVNRDGQVQPIALIVRINANEKPDAPDEETSYLAVSKITAERICVMARVKGGAKANANARKAADASADKPCLERERSCRLATPCPTQGFEGDLQSADR